jgi:uncharacterized protein (DUF302 family)
MTDPAEHASLLPFAETVARLTAAVGTHGLTVFAVIDHAANAQGVGLTMLPATVLIYGNPKGGTLVMQTTPLAALDLPLRVLVRQAENGSVTIAFHPVAGLEALGLPADAAAKLAPAQQLLLAAITP